MIRAVYFSYSQPGWSIKEQFSINYKLSVGDIYERVILEGLFGAQIGAPIRSYTRKLEGIIVTAPLYLN